MAPTRSGTAELGSPECKRSFPGLADGQEAPEVTSRSPAPILQAINCCAQFSPARMPSFPSASREGAKQLSQEPRRRRRRCSPSAAFTAEAEAARPQRSALAQRDSRSRRQAAAQRPYPSARPRMRRVSLPAPPVCLFDGL